MWDQEPSRPIPSGPHLPPAGAPTTEAWRDPTTLCPHTERTLLPYVPVPSLEDGLKLLLVLIKDLSEWVSLVSQEWCVHGAEGVVCSGSVFRLTWVWLKVWTPVQAAPLVPVQAVAASRA